MLAPLVVLALGALGSGFLLRNAFIGADFTKFWGASIAAPATGIMGALDTIPHGIALAPLIAAIIGIFIAVFFYLISPATPVALSRALKPVYLFLLNKWYFDELYGFLFVRPYLALARQFWQVGDIQIIDGVPNELATLTAIGSARVVRLQTGSIAVYAFAMLTGIVALVGLSLMFR
jgi:NADH-quinone oxidoreductase subunit L